MSERGEVLGVVARAMQGGDAEEVIQALVDAGWGPLDAIGYQTLLAEVAPHREARERMEKRREELRNDPEANAWADRVRAVVARKQAGEITEEKLARLLHQRWGDEKWEALSLGEQLDWFSRADAVLDAIGYQALVEEHRLGLTDEQWLGRVRSAMGRAEDAEAERDAAREALSAVLNTGDLLRADLREALGMVVSYSSADPERTLDQWNEAAERARAVLSATTKEGEAKADDRPPPDPSKWTDRESFDGWEQ